MRCGRDVLRITYRRACLRTHISLSSPNAEQQLDSVSVKWGMVRFIPFRLELFEDFPLRMVPDDLNIYETTKIKPLGSELGHVANAT